ncbi:hypothetical protein R3W88_018935 [Solanum pinnatisectum]|uniref:Prolamin-like domain-containing protein n=1 Tax=Solanum pinnatisectum TaxID=50273 RepID=A0AAV9KIP5_9SOLN|nr:hypothetical protein R3W88_018935 [Solanum pinnatisectum]
MSLVSSINMKIIFVLCLLIAIEPRLRHVVGVQGFGPGFLGGLGVQGNGRAFSFGSNGQGSGQAFSFGSGTPGSGPGFSSGLNNGGPYFWSFNGPEADKCLATLRNTPNCVQEIFGSLFKIPFHFIGAPFHSIGPQCCKVVRDIEDNCWPKIFPISPLFPLALKNLCNSQGQGQGQGQALTEQQPSSPPSPPQSDEYPNPLPSTPTSSPPPPQPYSYSFSFANKGD